MKELEKGHVYSLDNLKTGNQTLFQFYRDPAIHGQGLEGPSCQEIIRMTIARVLYLDEEKPWDRNPLIVQKLREVLLLFEIRALERKLAKGLRIESLSVEADGHLSIGIDTSNSGFPGATPPDAAD